MGAGDTSCTDLAVWWWCACTASVGDSDRSMRSNETCVHSQRAQLESRRRNAPNTADDGRA